MYWCAKIKELFIVFMPELIPESKPVVEVKSKPPDVLIDLEEDDDEIDDEVETELVGAHMDAATRMEEDARRSLRHAELLEEDRDAYDARRAELDAQYSTVPSEVDVGIGGPVERKNWWAARTFGAMRTEAGIVSVPKWLGYKGSSILTGIENWGKDMIKKNSPWVGKVPVVGTWLLSDVKKTWEERDKETAKKKDADAKKTKGDAEKAKKADEKKAKDAEVSLKKSQQASEKKTQAQDKLDEAARIRHEAELIGFMSVKEQFDFQNGDEETKKALLKKIEDELPTHQEKRKERERDTMLVAYMSDAEKAEFEKKFPLPPLESASNEEKAEYQKQVQQMTDAKEALRVKTESELHVPWRMQLAEMRKGQQKKKGGGKGKGKGRGGGRGRSSS